MNPIRLIERKRDGHSLTSDEIKELVGQYTHGDMPDYQMAALLMAIALRGMDEDEISALTSAMLHSGERLQFANLGPVVDKHSTGGVGDKVSLVLAPLVASAGLAVPMISGRGLGHSGGTLDKLDAIPGMQTLLDTLEIYRQMNGLKVCMVGQTERMVPADKKMYALRESTATVPFVPLITASILSKKLAEGLEGLVLDVKTGSGAFMKDIESARQLAQQIIRTASFNGLPTRAILTDMSQPLGYAVGNWLETREAIFALRGDGPDDLMTVTCELGAHMLFMVKAATSLDEARERLRDRLRSGKALETFLQMITSQGGDPHVIHHPETYPPSERVWECKSTQSGYIQSVDALTIGEAVVDLGGGRKQIKDRIDYKAGITLHKKRGDRVNKGDVMATVYTDRRELDAIKQNIRQAFGIAETEPETIPLIQETITLEDI